MAPYSAIGRPRDRGRGVRGGLRWLAMLAVCMAPAAVHAQTIVTSDKPDRVAVTIYRAPDRGAAQAISTDSPQGFALITETRTITLPAGSAVIRFEGVAGNIMPETAIITGLPQDVAEKNLDADLLSPRTLYDRALGRRVMIRRTDPATGRVREEQATIRSGAGGAAILQVAGGYEALRCSGLPETIVQPSVPEGLSARPTLSISTMAARPVSATVTLSYLAGGFDWQADYILSLRPESGRADLTAWVTLASSDVTTLPDAQAQVIAGRPNRERQQRFGPIAGGDLSLRCWPTSISYDRGQMPPPPAPPAPMPLMAAAEMMQDVVVTARRRSAKAVEVIQTELGDLKLYTVPMPTTVASQAQKQVALMTRPNIAATMMYVSEGQADAPGPARPVLRMRNRKSDGLGAPLPAGQVTMFQDGGGRPILIGQSFVADKAVDEEIELELPPTPGVTAIVEQREAEDWGKARRFTLIVSNANPHPIDYEARFTLGDEQLVSRRRLITRGGRDIWAARVPANGRATLTYSLRPRD